MRSHLLTHGTLQTLFTTHSRRTLASGMRAIDMLLQISAIIHISHASQENNRIHLRSAKHLSHFEHCHFDGIHLQSKDEQENE
jgi:hypothetical protein